MLVDLVVLGGVGGIPAFLFARDRPGKITAAFGWLLGFVISSVITSVILWYTYDGSLPLRAFQDAIEVAIVGPLLGVFIARLTKRKLDAISKLAALKQATQISEAHEQCRIGSTHYNGEGVQQNFVEAMRWFRMAADRGHAKAQYNLGYQYAKGEGVPQDYVRAHMWANLAAAQGVTDASKNRDAVAAQMTPAQIAEAQKLAREWKPTK